MEAGYRYNDNYRLGPPGTEIDVDGGEADAQLTLRTLDPRTQVEITPRVRATYFPNEPADDSIDYFLDGSVSTRHRAAPGVAANYSNEDVVRTEFPSPTRSAAISAIRADGDSGRVVEHNRRT